MGSLQGWEAFYTKIDGMDGPFWQDSDKNKKKNEFVKSLGEQEALHGGKWQQ